MTKRTKQLLFLLFVLLFPSLLYILLSTGKHNFIRLGYVGPKTVNNAGDTSYHSIAPFSFTNQYGEQVSDESLQGKIYVANFFFATCEGICPAMSSQLLRLQERFADKKDLVLLSHTVDPEHDDVEVLHAYSEKYKAIKNKWHFVTGNKADIYTLAQKSYLVNALEADDPSAEEAFIHSELFILIDKEKHIRGIYDGTSTAAVNDLIDDIKVLMAAYAIEEHKKKESNGGF